MLLSEEGPFTLGSISGSLFLRDHVLAGGIVKLCVIENYMLNGEVIRLDGAIRLPPR